MFGVRRVCGVRVTRVATRVVVSVAARGMRTCRLSNFEEAPEQMCCTLCNSQGAPAPKCCILFFFFLNPLIANGCPRWGCKPRCCTLYFSHEAPELQGCSLLQPRVRSRTKGRYTLHLTNPRPLGDTPGGAANQSFVFSAASRKHQGQRAVFSVSPEVQES